MPSHADFQRDNPFRPLDWRWRRANELLACRHNFCLHRDDGLTGRAVQYLRAADRCTTDRQKSNLRQRLPDIASARALHVEPAGRTVVVEARILAGERPAEIARHVSLNAADIVAYEQLFFDVRDRLNARTYIAKLAIGLTGAGDREDRHPGRVLKWFGYFGGSVVLDVVTPIILDAVPTFRTGQCLAVKTKLLAALVTLPFGENTARELDLLIDLAKPPRTAGTNNQSPLDGVSERIIEQAVEILGQRVIKDAAENDSQSDLGVAETETWKAA